MEKLDNHINYIEFQSTNLAKSKKFYGDVFGWTFVDWGGEYVSFDNAGLKGGFALVDNIFPSGTIVILYHSDLEGIKDLMTEAGGEIVREIFTFPGGKRFHFIDPSGNELAIWSEGE